MRENIAKPTAGGTTNQPLSKIVYPTPEPDFYSVHQRIFSLNLQKKDTSSELKSGSGVSIYIRLIVKLKPFNNMKKVLSIL